MTFPTSSTRSSTKRTAHKRPRVVVFFDHTAQLSGGEIVLLRMATHMDKTRWTPVVVLGSDGALREALERAEIETHVLAMDESVVQTRKDAIGGGSLLKLRAAWQMLKYSRKLAKFLKKRRADVLHCNSLKADIVGAIAAKMARVPLLWHIHDRIENDYLPSRVVQVLRFLCRRVPKGVVVNSQATLQTLHLPTTKKSRVIYPGVPLDEINEHRVLDVAETLENHAPRIGMVGRISRWKGQHVFLEAASQVREQFPNAQFVIVGAPLFGEEAYEKEVRAQCSRLGLDDCVTWTGFCDDVAFHVKGWDLQVHASTVAEPFGQVIIEAMALGKAIVATNGGGVPEIVRHDETGLLISMNDSRAMSDAILSLLRDRNRANEMGVRGRERVREVFTADQMARQLESFYDELAVRQH